MFLFKISEKNTKNKKLSILKNIFYLCAHMTKFLKNKSYLHNLAY
jgi:hypothetical protein